MGWHHFSINFTWNVTLLGLCDKCWPVDELFDSILFFVCNLDFHCHPFNLIFFFFCKVTNTWTTGTEGLVLLPCLLASYICHGVEKVGTLPVVSQSGSKAQDRKVNEVNSDLGSSESWSIFPITGDQILTEIVNIEHLVPLHLNFTVWMASQCPHKMFCCTICAWSNEHEVKVMRAPYGASIHTEWFCYNDSHHWLTA